MDEVKMNKVT